MTYPFNCVRYSSLLASTASCRNGKLRCRFPGALRKAGFFSVVYHHNAPLFLRSWTVITSDYCPGGHLPSINKAEERWRQVATLTPTARLDVEESRFRPAGATVGRLVPDRTTNPEGTTRRNKPHGGCGGPFQEETRGRRALSFVIASPALTINT
jgi:hypothetical protein